jgi:hypothetical protein
MKQMRNTHGDGDCEKIPEWMQCNGRKSGQHVDPRIETKMAILKISQNFRQNEKDDETEHRSGRPFRDQNEFESCTGLPDMT